MAQSLPVLLKNCNYLILTTSFAFFWAATLVIGVVLSQITDKFGFKSVRCPFILRLITLSLELPSFSLE